MARRSRNKSGVELILNGNWKVLVFFAFLITIVVFVVIPSLTNPILKALGVASRPIASIAIFILLAIAVIKFILEKNTLIKTTSTSRANQAFTSTVPLKSPIKPTQNNFTPATSLTWSLELLQDLEWKRFEELSTAYYLEKGIRAEATPLGPDGGIDIKLYQDDSGNPTSLIQCKAWYNKQVGVKEIREFLGVLTHEKIPKGFYMISGSFSEDAKETAKANKINLISGEMFLQMIKRLPEHSQTKLLTSATAGDYKTPSCSACGVKMIRRKGGKADFWGCANFPKCRQRMNIRKTEA